MALDRTAFEAYRRSAGDKTTLPRLIFGTILIVLAWLLVTLVVLFSGFYLSENYNLGLS
jgi:hypothetical protein